MSDATKQIPPSFTPKAPPGTETRNRSDVSLQTDVDLVTHVTNDNQVYTRKTLGQSKPAATTLTDLYTVPAATQVEVTSITVTEQNGAAAVFRISVAVAGAANTGKQYLAFDAPLAANAFAQFNLGIMLQPTDKIRVYSDTGNVSFNVFGVEVTAAP